MSTQYSAPYNPATSPADVARAGLAALPTPPDMYGFTTDPAMVVVYNTTTLTAQQISAFQTAVSTAAPDPNAPWNVLATLQSRAQTALTNNATFLGIASPTQAQAIAQVQALTRQADSIIRMLLGQLDSTANT